MQLQTNNLKFTNKLKHLFILFTAVFISNELVAQEIIPDEVKEEVVQDSVRPFQATKIDGVAAVVGDYIILDSDVDKAYLQLEAQGVNIKEIPRCQLFGKLLEDKLYAHHAIQDSIPVSDAEIRQNIDYQIQH